jgi:hypothetical protein
VEDSFENNLGMSRRTLLKRGAVVGGTLVWAAPAVQTLGRSAFAASPACDSTTCTDVRKNGVIVGHLCCSPSPADMNCPCVCAGLAPPSACPEADPCSVKFTCTGASSVQPFPGSCADNPCV